MKENTRFFIQLENDWFQEDKEKKITKLQELGADALVVYSILLRDLTLRNTIKFRITEILDVFKISINNSRMVQKIKDTFIKINGEIINIYIDSKCQTELTGKLCNNTTYYAKLKREQLKNNFFIVYDEEVDKIIKIAIDKKMSRDELLAQFLYFAKSFGGNEKEDNYRVCQMKADTIARYICTSRATVLRNNNILEDSGLILIGNAGVNKEDNRYTDTANIYARVDCKKEFNKYLEKQKTKVDIKYSNQVDKENIDIQRRLKQKINNWRKNHDVNNLCLEEWSELNILEREYVDFALKVRGQEKIKKGTGLITIKLNGTDKNYYKLDEEVKEPTNNVVNIQVKRKEIFSEKQAKNPFDKFQQKVRDSWGGEVDSFKLLDIDELIEETI